MLSRRKSLLNPRDTLMLRLKHMIYLIVLRNLPTLILQQFQQFIFYDFGKLLKLYFVVLTERTTKRKNNIITYTRKL